MQTYSEESVAAAAECTPRELASWTALLAKHGHAVKDGRVPRDHAVAIGAAFRFSRAGIGKARVVAIFRQLLRAFPEGDDWLVVDRRDRARPIEVERAPFEVGKVVEESGTDNV